MQKIAFDFDKVFVDYPPFVPTSVIDYLYKKKNGHLAYRYPGFFEKQIRIFSHQPIFRSPMKKNIAAVEKISEDKDIEMYVVSSRFSFLKNRTREWDKKNKVSKYFKKMYFNFGDEQPHLFKERILKTEKVDKFVDDDLDLLFFLAARNPKIKFYWINKDLPYKKLLPNITRVKDLSEFSKYL